MMRWKKEGGGSKGCATSYKAVVLLGMIWYDAIVINWRLAT